MAVGMGSLHLSPQEFWRVTPIELERALAGVFGEIADFAPLSRDTLHTLMHRYPDNCPT